MGQLEQRLENAGFHLLGEKNEILNLIEEILKSENIRYYKAIPFLLYEHSVDATKLKFSKKHSLLLEILLDYTNKIYGELKLSKRLFITFTSSQTKRDLFAKKNNLEYADFKEEFELQLHNSQSKQLVIDKQRIYGERELQMSLSALFTKKEKEIIDKVMNAQPLSKVEKEYYSRKTKKKLQSIISLNDFAKSLSRVKLY